MSAIELSLFSVVIVIGLFTVLVYCVLKIAKQSDSASEQQIIDLMRARRERMTSAQNGRGSGSQSHRARRVAR